MTIPVKPQKISVNIGTGKFGANPLASNTATELITKTVTSTNHGDLNGLGNDNHTQYLRVDGVRPLGANWDAGSYKITALHFESDVATGTAPLIVASTTKVTNLNADLLDDQSGAYYLDSANFTGTNWTDLTDAGDTTLHKHDIYAEIAGTESISGAWTWTTNPLKINSAIPITFECGTNDYDIEGTSGALVFNEDGSDLDFRVEGSGGSLTHLFFVDAGGKGVAINSNTNNNRVLNVVQNANSPAGGIADFSKTNSGNLILNIVAYGQGNAQMAFTSYSNTAAVAPIFKGSRGRGTFVSSAAVTTDDILFTIGTFGEDSDLAFGETPDARIVMRAAQSFTPTAKGTYFTFETTLIGTSAVRPVFKIWDTGSTTLLIDGTAFQFGADSDVTLSHIHNTGLLLNSTRQLQFNDANTYIYDDGTDLNLITNGVLKFGTHAAIGTEMTTGFITIKDNAGNPRKLAVVS